jgi:hypothetical protein
VTSRSSPGAARDLAGHLTEQAQLTTGAVSPESGLNRPRSYIEVEISPLRISVYERSGDGQTAALLRLLRHYGLRLEERVSSPCG